MIDDMPARRSRHGPSPWLITVLTLAMAVTNLAAASIGVLAIDIIPDLKITAGVIGALLAAHTVVGALLSPLAGSLADRLGGRRALVIVFACGAAGLLATSLAPNAGVIGAGMVLGAVGVAGANPATNRVITGLVDEGERGAITGIKQSGVQIAVLATGVLLPIGMATIGWRASVAVIAVLVAAAVPLTLAVVPELGGAGAGSARPRISRSPTVLLLAAYVFLMGFANAAPLFIPLYAETELGAGAALGGLALALVGLASIPGRITWARVAERRGTYRRFLVVFAIGGALAYMVVLLSGPTSAWWLLAVGALAIGATSNSWNAVVTLAVLRTSDERPGAATGTVMLGFFLGLSVASPAYGAAVDTLGFAPVWLLAITALGGAALIALAWTERRARPT